MIFKQTFSYLIKLAIAVGIIWYMFHAGILDISSLYKITDNYLMLVLVFLILLLGVFVTFYRWKLLLKGLDIELKNEEIISLGFIGLFFSSILPGAVVGGDVMKSVYIANKIKNKKTESILTIILDRIIGLTALIMIGVISLLVNYDMVIKNRALSSLALILILILSVVIILAFFGLSRRVSRNKIFNYVLKNIPMSNMVNRVYEAFHYYRTKRKYLVYALLISFLNHALNISAFYTIVRVLDFNELSIYSYLFIIPIGLITTAIPITPAGIGIGQAAFLKLFEWFLGKPSNIGAEAITIWQAISIVIFLSGGYFYITYRRTLIDKYPKQSQDQNQL